MKILLLGGTGIISSEVMNVCLEKNYNITIFNRGNNNDKISTEVKIIKGDFKKLENDNILFKNLYFDVIVDFLSRKPDDLIHLYSIFKEKCNQYIFISTACVYLRNVKTQNECIVEDSPKPNGNWTYSVDKYECEEALRSQAKKYKKIYTIVRPYITYGNTRIPFGLTPPAGLHWTIIKRIISGKPFFVWDTGDTTCTFTHSIDFAKGIVGLFNNPKAINEDFHITSDEIYSWNDFLKILYEVLGCKLNVVNIPSILIARNIPEYKGILLEDRKYNASFDNSKIKDAVPELSFNISLRKGIQDTILYYKNSYNKKIDYIYDSKIDKLISKFTTEKIGYIDYLKENSRINHIKYLAYRYLHPKLAFYTLVVLKKIKFI